MTGEQPIAEELNEMYLISDEKRQELINYIKDLIAMSDTNDMVSDMSIDINFSNKSGILNIFNFMLSLTNKYSIIKDNNKTCINIQLQSKVYTYSLNRLNDYLLCVLKFFNEHKIAYSNLMYESIKNILKNANVDLSGYTSTGILRDYPLFKSWDMLLSMVSKIPFINNILDSDKEILIQYMLKNNITDYIYHINKIIYNENLYNIQ